jgi:hypothetical protein
MVLKQCDSPIAGARNLHRVISAQFFFSQVRLIAQKAWTQGQRQVITAQTNHKQSISD